MRSVCGAMAALVILPAAVAAPAETIYYGGDILTMKGNSPHYVQRLAVRNGRIVYAGSASGVAPYKGAATQAVNLHGRTLMPGFIDAHGHIIDYSSRWTSPDLSPPPVSDVTSINGLVDKMKKHVRKSPPPPGRAAFGSGYDDSLLRERRHPTRIDLDRISQSVPVVIVHASGHLVVANSPALKLAGITRNTADPPGGVIQKDPATGEPNGILEEQAACPCSRCWLSLLQKNR